MTRKLATFALALATVAAYVVAAWWAANGDDRGIIVICLLVIAVTISERDWPSGIDSNGTL